MNLIELLFIIVCLWILYIGISFAFQDIREAEKELEERRTPDSVNGNGIMERKEDNKLL